MKKFASRILVFSLHTNSEKQEIDGTSCYSTSRSKLYIYIFIFISTFSFLNFKIQTFMLRILLAGMFASFYSNERGLNKVLLRKNTVHNIMPRKTPLILLIFFNKYLILCTTKFTYYLFSQLYQHYQLLFKDRKTFEVFLFTFVVIYKTLWCMHLFEKNCFLRSYYKKNTELFTSQGSVFSMDNPNSLFTQFTL